MKYYLPFVVLLFCGSLNYAQHTPFISETFGSGTTSSLPAGWTTTVIQGPAATWKWMNKKSSTRNAIDPIQSTTAADGWMLLDVDSIGAANPSANLIESVLTSPSYNCSGHPHVVLRYQQHFRKHYDSVSVEVSNGTHWNTLYPSSSTLLPSPSSTSNPDLVALNISQFAGGQSNVQIRFHYFDSYTAGGMAYGYSWMVDDLSLTDADSVDLKASSATVFGIINTTSSGYFPFTSMPVSLADTFVTVGTFSNLGFTSNTAARVVMTTTRNGVMTGTDVQSASLPVYTMDAGVNLSPMVCPATGTYTTTYTIDTTADGDKTNNTDTALSFTISDSLYADLPKKYTKDFIMHAPGSPGLAEISFSIATELYVPAGKSDTLTGISVAFAPSTKPNVTVSAFITFWDGSAWNLLDFIGEKTLSASDITSDRNAPVFTYIRANHAYPLELGSGIYAIVIACKHIASSDSAYLLGGPTITPVQYLSNPVSPASIYDTSSNDGLPVTPSSGLYYAYFPYTTSIRAHFGRFISSGIANVNESSLHINVYPNPAKGELHIRYNVSNTTDMTVELINALGEVVTSQAVGHVRANIPGELSVNTAGLPSGAYFYIVRAGQLKETGNVTIVH